MRLFWKVYLLSLCLLVSSMALLTSVTTIREARRSAGLLRNEQRLLAVLAASQVEAGYHEQVWPFEMLSTVSRNENFLFWRIVDGDGHFILADRPLKDNPDTEDILLRSQPVRSEPTLVSDALRDTNVWIVPMRMRTADKPWTFWLGFHTRTVQRQMRGMILAKVLPAAAIAVILIPTSLLLTRKVLRPLTMLTAAAEEMKRGDLSVSLPPPGRDEIGQLVGAFEAMVAGIKTRDLEIDDKMQALKEARDDLEMGVRERTAELTKTNIDLKHEITEHKRAEQALRESEERLRIIFEAAENVAFITTDLAGRDAHIREFSPGAEHIFGYRREEVVGQPVAMLHLPEDVARFPEVIQTMRQKRHGFSGEYTLVRKSGEHFPALFRTYPLFDGEGQMIATLGVSIDITERKRAEEQLKKTLAELQEFNRLAVGRELRMVELKREVNEMAQRAHLAAPYDVSFAETAERE